MKCTVREMLLEAKFEVYKIEKAYPNTNKMTCRRICLNKKNELETFGKSFTIISPKPFTGEEAKELTTTGVFVKMDEWSEEKKKVVKVSKVFLGNS